jgi:hypothetical protein
MSGANIEFATTEDLDAIGYRNLVELSEVPRAPLLCTTNIELIRPQWLSAMPKKLLAESACQHSCDI